jgi:signal transduction histidine kinase
LLDVGRIGSGQLALDRSPTDLVAIVADMVESCSELARSGSAFTIDAQRTTGCWDRTRLEQIVSNLISNAAKYGAGRPIHVIVEGDDRRATLTGCARSSSSTPRSTAGPCRTPSRVG